MSNKNIAKINKVILVIFFSSVALLYLKNLTRDIYSGDIGDLVTAAYLWGVAHPPGYPLFTFLGGILSSLPLPLPVVSKVGLISIAASLLALFFFYQYCRQISKSFFIALLSTSILAFSYFFWFHAEIPEVFALNNLFAVLLFFLAFQYYQKGKIKYLYLLAFFSALALTHHHTILFIFPGLFILIRKNLKLVSKQKHGKIYLLLFIILGFSIYLYVPLAASKNPAINWDNASNLNNFLTLILRKSYGGFYRMNIGYTFVPFYGRFIIIKDFFLTLLTTYSIQIFLVALLGVWQLFKTDRRLFLAVFLAFFLAGPFFIFYAGPFIPTVAEWGVIERFYVLPSLIFLFFLPYGFLFLKNFLNSLFSQKALSSIMLAYFIIIPIFLIKYNYPRTNLAPTKIGNTFAQDLMSLVPKDAVLILSGDTATFNTWYVYHVLKKRPDINLINYTGAGGNQFLDYKIAAYLKKNPKSKKEHLFYQIMRELKKKTRVFTVYSLDYLPEDFILIPKGLLYEVNFKKEIPTKEKYLQEVKNNLNKLHLVKEDELTPAEKNLTTREIPTYYANSLRFIGGFLEKEYQDSPTAISFYNHALEIDSDNPDAFAALGLAQYKNGKMCQEAEKNLKKAITLYPILKYYYQSLYAAYQGCGKTKQAGALKKQYFDYFNERMPTLTF